MNKKSVVALTLLFAAAGLILANTVKAQDTTSDNSVMNSDNGTTAAPADQ